MSDKPSNNEIWQMILTGQMHEMMQLRRVFELFPSGPRCRLCASPFSGFGGQVARYAFRKVPSRINPHFCSTCYTVLTTNPGGAEIEISLLFADIRGSTTLAEEMGTAAYSRFINRFYIAATGVFSHTNAWIDRLVGDQVIGLYLPFMAGEDHARNAIRGARQLLKAVGYGSPDGPWIPLGVGVHTGVTFMGSVGTQSGMQDVTVLGDTVNATARLSSVAAAGEILISDAACAHSGIDVSGLEQRTLQLKGRVEPLNVRAATLESLGMES